MAGILIQALRSRWASAGCLLVVLLAAVLPPNGFGVPVCQFRSLTGLPCFGCGLTRSFIGMAHLHFARAAFYHPVGAVLFPLVLGLALLLPAGPAARERLVYWTESHRVVVNRGGVALLALFLIYGAGRIAWLLIVRQPSPW